MRRIYHRCRLVHGDLSEFNLLYHEGKAFVIDVSQSVEHDHPSALEFLRKDLSNITDFFRRRGVPNVLGVRALFDFVVDPNIEDEEEELEKISQRQAESKDEEDEEVFKQIYIPRTLDEVTRKHFYWYLGQVIHFSFHRSPFPCETSTR